jgi:hypothetical protein
MDIIPESEAATRAVSKDHARRALKVSLSENALPPET